MDAFISYLTGQIEAGRDGVSRLEADGRADDAVFLKVRTNIYEICRTVTTALRDRPGAGPKAVKAQFERFESAWGAALESAKAHDDARNIVIEENKLQALADVMAHLPEVTQ